MRARSRLSGKLASVRRGRLPEQLARLLIRAYQLLVSPLLGPRCRFWPSCSNYALQAIDVHGVAPGLLLAAKRLLRCHPWCVGGVDPVPDRDGFDAPGSGACGICQQPTDAFARRAWPDAQRDGS